MFFGFVIFCFSFYGVFLFFFFSSYFRQGRQSVEPHAGTLALRYQGRRGRSSAQRTRRCLSSAPVQPAVISVLSAAQALTPNSHQKCKPSTSRAFTSTLQNAALKVNVQLQTRCRAAASQKRPKKCRLTLVFFKYMQIVQSHNLRSSRCVSRPAGYASHESV